MNMARNATPLLRAQPLPELHGGVELLIVESLLAHPDPSQGDGYEEEHSLCVLVLASPTEVERRMLRVEAQRYISAQASVVPVAGAAWAAEVIRLLDAMESAFIDVVIALPEPPATAEREVTMLLRGLKAGHHLVSTVVAVAQNPGDWRTLDAGLGMVSAPGHSAAAGAILLHAGLAQRSAAPGLVSCLSGEEINAVWGSSERPAQLSLVDLDGSRLEVCAHPTPGLESGVIFCLAPVTLTGYKRVRHALNQADLPEVLIIAPSGLSVWSVRRQAVLVMGGGVKD